jgi:hypothetical protein
METCIICKGEQDSKHYKDYNICTECFDLMEDLMSEYFLRTLKYEGSNSRKGYLKYLENSKQYLTDYQRIRRRSKSHLKHMGEQIKTAFQEGAAGSRQRYLERLMQTLSWLERYPEFYNYYFKEYYLCPNCNASLFDHYEKQEIGDWLIINCERCGTTIKKYFLPKFMD